MYLHVYAIKVPMASGYEVELHVMSNSQDLLAIPRSMTCIDTTLFVQNERKKKAYCLLFLRI